MRVKKNEKKLSDLHNFLESLAVCGDYARAAGSAGVSAEQLVQWLNQWFNNPNPDILRKIALARYKAQMRKTLRAPLMTREDFVEVLRHCRLQSTKTGKVRDNTIINLLIKNPRISNEDGARKLKITVAAYKMRKKRLFEALFERLTIPLKK